MGKVSLIGAGPGDAGLITVKGMECLKRADVIVYDRLACDALLQYAKADAVLIYVGKKAGAHSVRQEEINRILVGCAKKYTRVVRLKGGDSFVFGRGGEEIEALERENLPYELIPGVTSAVAAPESAGIPVTHRGVSHSFHVVTGHTKDGREALAEDFEILAKAKGTLVFLMGLANLEWIAAGLTACGMAADTPAAVIADGTLPQEICVKGTLADIAKRVRRAGLQSPAVIVVGKTAALSFRDRREQRVFGMVGTQEMMERFADGLTRRAADLRAAALMTMERVPLPQEGELAGIMRQIDAYGWIFFTSRQAVRQFFQTARTARLDMRRLASCRFAVLGEGTYDALREYGIYADFKPGQADGESFAKEFIDRCLGARSAGVPETEILLPRARRGGRKMVERLRDAGIKVRELSVYDVQGMPTARWDLVETLQDYVFFSASGVEAFLEQLNKTGMRLREGSRCYAIGDLTAKALRRAFGERAAMGEKCEVKAAPVSSVEGLLDLIAAQAPESGGQMS